MDAQAGVQRLLALLSMLPNPDDDDDREAWDSLWRQIGKAIGQNGMDFWADKFAQVAREVREATPGSSEWAERAGFLASLPAMTLDVQGEARTQLERLLNLLAPYMVASPGAFGRRWLDDLLATAWDVQVALMDKYSAELRAEEAATVRDHILKNEQM